MSDLRDLPSIDSLLRTEDVRELVRRHGKPLVLTYLRRTIQGERDRIHQGGEKRSQKDLILSTSDLLRHTTTLTLRPVINATGVVLHTNLGRACLSEDAVRSINGIGDAYSTLEFDLDKGGRGHRSDHVEKILKELLDVEDAYVVNNNAGAVLLVLSALAARKRVIVSRTQLIEIGGGFRIPEVLRLSGAKMVEIGTTNRVHLSDYTDALQESAAIVLRAHHSNFKVVGFSSEPDFSSVIDMAHANQAIVVDDIGSGALLDTSKFGLAHEPMVQESLKCGADIVCFSGDKLLGGPQAGIVVGKKELLRRIKKHPLARALRAEKLLLAGLQATLMHYLKDEAVKKIPIWQMISKKPAELKHRVTRWIRVLGRGEIMAVESTIGGGSLPGETLPTYALGLRAINAGSFLQQLRKAAIPIVARVNADVVLLDPRTVLEEQDEDLLATLKSLLKKEQSDENRS